MNHRVTVLTSGGVKPGGGGGGGGPSGLLRYLSIMLSMYTMAA